MKAVLFLSAVLLFGARAEAEAPAAPDPGARTRVVVVVGAAGSDEYASIFEGQVAQWRKLCARAEANLTVIGPNPPQPEPDRDRLRTLLEAEPKDGLIPLWLILIGHGTFDGDQAKFNLRGPDLTATDLALWLKPFHRSLAVIDTTSASAPFLAALSGPNRVIITATRSGNEQNYARFGPYFVAALADPQSDLDRDGEVSLLEAFLSASARVAEFYQTAGRLATEHPMLDDNGDGLGTPPDWFQGTRAVKKARDGAEADGPLAAQFALIPSPAERRLAPAVRARRDQLELAIARLRDRKSQLGDDAYYAQLEKLLLQVAELYQSAR